MYVSPNFKTKKALKDAVKEGREVMVFQPNNIFNTPIPKNGTVSVEGPHYPQPHSWYARVTLEDGVIISVK